MNVWLKYPAHIQGRTDGENLRKEKEDGLIYVSAFKSKWTQASHRIPIKGSPNRKCLKFSISAKIQQC